MTKYTKYPKPNINIRFLTKKDNTKLIYLFNTIIILVFLTTIILILFFNQNQLL